MTGEPFNPSSDAFEHIYRSVGADLERVPWALLTPHPELVAWLERHLSTGRAAEDRALVVGCGLGDDAEELARRTYAVTAFDLSPTAIAACARRFPTSRVTYTVADLLSLSPSWARAFDLVVEVNTIQSLPPEQHAAGMAAIAGTVADNGTVFVRCSGRFDQEPTQRRPWPLSRAELQAYVDAGLEQTSLAESWTGTGNSQFVATYRRTTPPERAEPLGRERDTPIRTGV